MKADVSILLAAYNESAGIEENLRKLTAYVNRSLPPHEIVVVDDGSTDNTWSILKRLEKPLRLKLARNTSNQGQGAAFRKGFALARGSIVITMDSDLSYPLRDILRMLGKIREGNDVVVASPFVQGGMQGVPLHRQFLSALATWLYSAALGLPITCYTGAFRAYRASALKKISFKTNRFEAQTEILWRCARAGLRITEIASRLRAPLGRRSRFRLWRELGAHLLLFGSILLNRVGLGGIAPIK